MAKSTTDEIRRHRVGKPFSKGYDPRRVDKAQHRNAALFREKCRGKTDEALRFLVETLQDEDAPFKARYDCATYIIDQAHGKAPNFVALQQEVKREDVGRMGLDELEQMIASHLSGNAREVRGEVIESVPTRAGDIMDGLAFTDAPVPLGDDDEA